MIEAHHRYGPSALASYEVCPGYLPDNDKPVHPVTEAGSRMHDATERDDYSNLEHEVEEELVKKVQAFEEKNTPPGGVEYREKKIPFLARIVNLLKGTDQAIDQPFGTYDRLVTYENKGFALMFDYKYGFHPVPEVEHNIQMQAYALGIFEQFDWLERIRVFILQPRVDWVSYHEFTRDDCLWIEKRIFGVIQAAIRNDPKEYRASYWNCIYCARQLQCPHINELASHVVTKYRDDVVFPEEVHSSEVNDPDVMGQLLDIKTILEGWCESVKFHAQRLFEEQGDIATGYTPVTRTGRRKIEVPSLAIKIATDEFKIPLEEVLNSCDVKPGTMDKIIKDFSPKGEKQGRVDRYNDRLRDAGILNVAQPTTYLKKEHKE